MAMRGLRLQSAMEYLMTYGWMIIIVALVIGAIAALGLFNGNSLSPKAPPGSCSLDKPDGPWSTTLISLVGPCSNGLPEYVAKFNGVNSSINLNGGQVANVVSTGITISSWIYLSESQTAEAASQARIFSVSAGYCGETLFFDAATTIRFSDDCGDFYEGTYSFKTNQWYQVVVTVTPGSSPEETYYVNGRLVSQGSSSAWTLPEAGLTDIGAYPPTPTERFDGEISNVQLYNTSLSSNDVVTLYSEGIGGGPMALQWLVGWWPLNGDANDYSGNGDNAASISNVIFYTGWTGGYSNP